MTLAVCHLTLRHCIALLAIDSCEGVTALTAGVHANHSASHDALPGHDTLAMLPFLSIQAKRPKTRHPCADATGKERFLRERIGLKRFPCANASD